jgi:SH3-like domain-containing protein
LNGKRSGGYRERRLKEEFGMRRAIALAMILFVTALSPAAVAQKERKTPYWASIAASEALMRSGPGKNYPAKWLYRRGDLPIKVLEVYPSWRKVQDPDGESGWMLVNLLSDQRTALVTGTEPRPMHETADGASRTVYLVQPGVVGRLEQCAANWCEMDVRGRRGHIRTEHIWGVDPNESF